MNEEVRSANSLILNNFSIRPFDTELDEESMSNVELIINSKLGRITVPVFEFEAQFMDQKGGIECLFDLYDKRWINRESWVEFYTAIMSSKLPYYTNGEVKNFENKKIVFFNTT